MKSVSRIARKNSSTTKVSQTAQKKITAKAKKSVLKISGKTTHVKAHVQAANQRKQARRDAKNT